MAHPLARTAALDLLEDGVHALRALPLSTLVCHPIGAVPLVLGLLLFWNDMAQPRTPDSRCALEALALTLFNSAGGQSRAGRAGDSGGWSPARRCSAEPSHWPWRWLWP